jgi:Zn-dependent protease with chaperone function/competence protein ComGC
MSTSASVPLNVSVKTLTLPKEGTYFAFVLVISILVWLGVAISIIGIFYAGLFALIAWFGSGLLTAHLRAEALRVDEKQLPELHATFLNVCQKLGVRHPPKLYVLQAGGALNAFATRFAGRDFVVVYADMLDAFGPASAEMQFILGHELGHLKSNHLMKRILLAPGIFAPLIGPAYLRACEASCDRHGAFVADNLEGALRAMLTLSGGKHKERTLDPIAFAAQYRDERGFFVSWHELTSAYPTLSQRSSHLLALRDPQYAPAAPRSPLAYLFALVTPGGQLSGGANILIFIVVIGLLAAMAIPAFSKVRDATARGACANNISLIQSAYAQSEMELGQAPERYEQFIGKGQALTEMPDCPAKGEYSVTPTREGGCEVLCSIHGDAKSPTVHTRR